MKYNFDEIIDRKHTDSIKYDGLSQFLGCHDALPMWVADTDFKTPPFIVEALKTRLNHEIFGYSFKSERYFNSIIHWIEKRDNWTIKKDWISFSPGVVSGFTLAIEQFTKPGDKILVQPPVYFPFFQSITNTGRQVVNNPLKLENGRLNIDFDDLECKIDPDIKMLLLCNPHNPGGSVWTKAEMLKIQEICHKHNILVVSDEIHADVVYYPNKFVPFASISDEAAQNSITVRSHSKTFNVAGLTTSYAIIPNKKLLHDYNKKLQTPHLHMGNIFGTEALIAAYEHGEEWLEQLLDYLSENIRLVTNFFEKNYPEIKVIKPESTFLVWIDFRSLNLSGKELKDLFFNKIKIAINEGSMFGAEGEGFIRLNVGCPKSTIQKALELIKNELK